jgi:hypothetical protein
LLAAAAAADLMVLVVVVEAKLKWDPPHYPVVRLQLP